MLELVLLFAFPAAVAFAGATDLFSMTIPNRISLAMIAGFICVAPFAGLGLEAMAWHFAAGLLVLVVTAGMFFMGWIGGGDAKLTAAVALWIGFDLLVKYLIVASLLGGVLSLAFIVFRKLPLPASAIRQIWIARLHAPKGGIPYGIALAAAAIIIYPETLIYGALSG
jgi:prepilin peptidase CpaA